MPPLNFRDVGECISILLDTPSPIRPGVLLRGGKLDVLDKLEDLGSPRTILNLRRGPDPEHLQGVTLVHVPALNTVENYRTELSEVREWLREALSVLTDPATTYPIYVHCTSGKDRTGIVIAVVLRALDVPAELIIEEYLLSEGVARETIELALAGLGDVRSLVDREALERALGGPGSGR